ncbi:MAG: helix-turn-helix transcriptional regulator [Anaerolineales bacterium]|nr:helix-turn-helix transcriptional regulator [Anaerolineales bacterium]MCB8937061.1 helix-turn-helix transcriptional regulator [Ardenticatenaceae bacterium]
MNQAAPTPESHLPLTPTVFHILLALADKERHGYGIIKEIEARTNGRIRIMAGTLYGAIKRLLERGLIAETDDRPDPELDDERRRYYQLTDFGQRVLTAEVVRLEEQLRQAQSKQLLAGNNSAQAAFSF